MAIAIHYDEAAARLRDAFALAQRVLLGKADLPRPASLPTDDLAVVFASRTQAYREVLLGSVLARLADRGIDLTKPYAKQGHKAYNGRTLDEKVVNPILREMGVPCSRGPFLAVFRRSVTFEESTGVGSRDKVGYGAFLRVLRWLGEQSDNTALSGALACMAAEFLRLREGASIPVSRLSRMSLEQYDTLMQGLLDTPSGGRFPVLLVAAAFEAVRAHFGLRWQIECQGINVADGPSGAGGDITIRDGPRILMAAEVTERSVDGARVLATFQAKILPQGIEDYLFFLTRDAEASAFEHARRYFPQGHEVNFVEVKNGILMTLATLGASGRSAFNRALVARVESGGVPASLKVAWNDEIARLTAGPAHVRREGLSDASPARGPGGDQ